MPSSYLSTRPTLGRCKVNACLKLTANDQEGLRPACGPDPLVLVPVTQDTLSAVLAPFLAALIRKNPNLEVFWSNRLSPRAIPRSKRLFEWNAKVGSNRKLRCEISQLFPSVPVTVS